MTARWYVVQTHTHGENKAAMHLERQGYGVYLPRYLRRRRHARRVDTVAAPLFPRYLFVSVDMATQRWRSIESTCGVSRLVCNGDEPAMIAQTVMEMLKRREDDNGFIALGQQPRFSVGAQVRVLDGVFADCLGLFDGMDDNARVSVLLDLLGRKVRVLLDDFSIAAA